jgi:hypothetical protein
MDDKTMRRYYESFMSYMAFTQPHVAFLLQGGMIDAEKLKPYIREWAVDICADKEAEPTHVA